MFLSSPMITYHLNTYPLSIEMEVEIEVEVEMEIKVEMKMNFSFQCLTIPNGYNPI